MRVGDVLTTAYEELPPLRSPVMVIALRGWFDVSDAATDALRELCDNRHGVVVASIDPDPFFDFTQERPQVWLDDAELRHVTWPTNSFVARRMPDQSRDLVVLRGVEPHLRYATFADSIITVAQGLGCRVVVTVGAAVDAVPHTRPPLVVGSTTNNALATALGLTKPRYEGVTGLVGVLQERLDHCDLPAISLRVSIPHYLANAKHPRSSLALLQHLGHVLGLPLAPTGFDDEVDRWRTLHDEAVLDDAQARAYVGMLEREYDRRAEAQLPTADDLAAEFERFLRDQGSDPA
jgi:proteasome assembly chaperone (PAC2) family protein